MKLARIGLAGVAGMVLVSACSGRSSSSGGHGARSGSGPTLPPAVEGGTGGGPAGSSGGGRVSGGRSGSPNPSGGSPTSMAGRGGSAGMEGGAPAGGEAGETTSSSGGMTGASGRGAGGAAGVGGATGPNIAGAGGITWGPDCGNGMLDVGEGCDDTNHDSGDGCSANCVIEHGFGCDGQMPTHCRRPWVSCVFLEGDDCQGGDCCAGTLVEGGTFTQGNGTASSFSSTVSTFLLDNYEVTVGRFRTFVSLYDGWREQNPQPGAGANPHVPASGWKSGWDAYLPADASALQARLACDSTYQTWADTGNDALPVNCVDWYTAFAFCIWDDGGRLPTEAEWEYAAAGGLHENVYPWGDGPAPTNTQDATATYANYDCLGDGSAPGACALADLLPVGSKPAGKGFYGQQDLAGSLWEWTLDGYDAYPTTASTDYANVDANPDRVVRGGNWYRDASVLKVTNRSMGGDTTGDRHVGLRCARAP
jgi:formylglycine-generating enzyme